MRYKTIRNTKLFNKILRSEDKWKSLFTADYELEDKEIPVFAGQLDRITVKTKGVYYDDTGCNGRDFSFVIRPEKEGVINE